MKKVKPAKFQPIIIISSSSTEPFVGPWPVRRTPWTGDQPVIRLQPTHKATHTAQPL
jgi:hypothetical protein